MTVQYKCNVCNRTIDVPENKRGLDVFGNCIITKQCKGALFFVKNKPNILRNLDPEPSEYDDWVYDPQIVTFTQNHARSIWKFKHTLTAVPSLSVYIWTVDSNNKPIAVQYTDNLYTYTFDNQYLELKFTSKVSGMVQCVVRNTTAVLQQPKIDDTFVKVTTSGLVTVAVHTHNKLFVAGDTDPITGITQLHSNALSILLNEVQVDYDLGSNDPSQAWGNISQIFMYGNTYNISTFNVIADMSSSIHNYSAYRYVGEDPTMYILTSKSNNFVDKVYDKAINMFELTVTNNYIKNNELYVSPSIIRDCYPHIKLL
jgi:hypothetical protein